MGKKARIVHKNPHEIDFAPGIENIVKRIDGVAFYAVETFHTSPFWDKITPVFASDVNSSRSLTDVYGISGLSAMRQNVILLKNHPVRKVRMTGRITEYFVKEFRNSVFYFVSIDDTSGDEMICRISQAMLLGAGLNHLKCEGTLIEVVGRFHLYNDKYELNVESLSIFGNSSASIKDEIKFWKEAFAAREVIKTPWYQSAQIEDDSDPVFRLDDAAKRRKMIHKNLILTEGKISQSPIVLDSSIYIRKKNRTPKPECSDSGDTSTLEIEDVTKVTFERNTINETPLYGNIIDEMDHAWVYVSNRSSFAFSLEVTPETELVFLLMKWMINNKEEKFSLNKPFKDPKISRHIKAMARKKFPVQVVDLTIPNATIKTVGEIYGEIFHDARHTLQSAGVIKCSLSKNCDASTLLHLIKYLKRSLIITRDNCFCFKVQNFLITYNKEYQKNIQLDILLIELLIHWYLSNEDDKNWRYNKQRNEWTYQEKRRELRARRSHS